MRTALHHIFILVSITASSGLNAQTQLAPNGDFESCTGFNPDLWYTLQAPGNVQLINQVPGNGGGLAHRADVIYDIELESYLNPFVQIGPQEGGTFPVDAQYSWCLSDYQFHNAGDDGLYVTVSMPDDDDNEVGFGSVYLADNITSFTTYSLSIGNLGIATKARITFVITDPDELPEFDGSYFIIDNVRLSETPATVTPHSLNHDAAIALSPNPAANCTTLTITLPVSSAIDCTILNCMGMEVMRQHTHTNYRPEKINWK